MADLTKSTLSPMEYLKIFFRRKWFVIVPTFAGLVIGLCTGILLPKKYKSSTVILVQESKTDNPLISNLAVSSSIDQRLNTIRESMLGWNSLVQLVKKLNLDRDIKSSGRFEELILDIRNHILIQLRGPSIIEVAYMGAEPKTTQAIVKTITDIFIERNLNLINQETEDAIKFIDEQLRVYRGKIKSAEIAQLQDRLDFLLVDSTENHPTVKELRDQIKNKKEELAKENLEYTENIILEESNNPIIHQIKSAIDTLDVKGAGVSSAQGEDEFLKFVLMDKLDNVMARDVQVNEQIYNVLLQRLETAKITQRLQSSKEGIRYTVVDPARLPFKPFSPNKPLVAALGFLAGLVLGVGLVVMAEFLDKSFIDVQDAKAFFGAPLLGAISKINTTESIHEERVQQRWYLFLTLMAGVAVIVITLILKTFLA